MATVRSRVVAVSVSTVCGAFLASAPRSSGQDEAILRAIQSGAVSFGNTKVAVPAPPAASSSNAAPAVPSLEPSPLDGILAISRVEERSITDRAYPLMSAKWPFNAVFVCWESPTPVDEKERHWVQDSAESTWARNSGIRFVGWQKCTSDAVRGIRIAISDTGPHVKYLGKFVDGVQEGMVLNFVFANWSPSCRDMREYCIRAIAVHEFGHAIGFAHEQNRPDTPGDCAIQKQGTDGDLLLTPWDPQSVMNYCNPKYNNNGQLSAFDVKAVQYVYGPPRPQP